MPRVKLSALPNVRLYAARCAVCTNVGGLERGWSSVGLLWGFEEEPNHFTTGTRSVRGGIRARRTPTRPGVPRSVQHPLLDQDAPTFIGVGSASVRHPARR